MEGEDCAVRPHDGGVDTDGVGSGRDGCASIRGGWRRWAPAARPASEARAAEPAAPPSPTIIRIMAAGAML